LCTLVFQRHRCLVGSRCPKVKMTSRKKVSIPGRLQKDSPLKTHTLLISPQDSHKAKTSQKSRLASVWCGARCGTTPRACAGAGGVEGLRVFGMDDVSLDRYLGQVTYTESVSVGQGPSLTEEGALRAGDLTATVGTATVRSFQASAFRSQDAGEPHAGKPCAGEPRAAVWCACLSQRPRYRVGGLSPGGVHARATRLGGLRRQARRGSTHRAESLRGRRRGEGPARLWDGRRVPGPLRGS
jgi:hypothetical protein